MKLIVRTIAKTIVMMTLGTGSVSVTLAQGQDSARHERDLQVIQTMLPGHYVNANQSYFDARGDRSIVHDGIAIDVQPDGLSTKTEPVFRATISAADGERTQIWWLAGDDAKNAVRMRSHTLSAGETITDWSMLADRESCDVYWRREAAQFRATADDGCAAGFATELVLSDAQFWFSEVGRRGADYELHRTRAFECYADVPGVGGGRDEPFERYGPFPVHDQGGAAWFDTNDGRRLGISLFLVDWPINNYTGIFTRDSLVIYVNEQLDDERKQHGYAFTLPEADRVGINLKWILANCYMESNEVSTPYM